MTNLLSQLENVKQTGGQWTARCPCHEDKHNSLSVRQLDDKWLLFCHAGCQYRVIAEALGLIEEPVESAIEAVYDYIDIEGKTLYQVVRYRPKTFKQRHWNSLASQWQWDLEGVTPVLFHLPKVVASDTVYFVEGEKDAMTLDIYGLTATTMSGGSTAKWQPGYTQALEGKTVILIADVDYAGAKWLDRVGALLFGWADVKVITLPYGNDVSDFVTKGGDPRTLEIIDLIPPKGYATKEELYDLRQRFYRNNNNNRLVLE